MIFATVLISFALFLVFGLWRFTIKTRQLSFPTWHELAMQIQPVEKQNVRDLALDYLDPTLSTADRSPEEIWDMVGGVEGLTRMRRNAKVLIALAAYAQQWNHDESVIVAERMRHDSLRLRRAVVGLGVGIFCGYGRARVLAYVHEIASCYHLMRERLLALYKNTQPGEYPSLLDAV